MPWHQVYDPLNSSALSTAVAAAPVVLLLGLLVAGLAAHWAALTGLAVALAIAAFVFGMPPELALASAAYGACFGLLPIGWIVVGAVFLFHLTVRSGQFEVVKRSVAALSPDRRMQALLIAFSFGSFLEGAAGFGTPVAISAALLIGVGFTPLYAAGLALLANTSPVAFGALGTPIITLARVSGLPEMSLSQMAGRQLPFFSLLVPFWLVWVMGGWRGIRGAWPAIFVSGVSFATLQYTTANYFGPTLVDVVGGLGSMIALALFLRVWQPKTVWRFPHEPRQPAASATPGALGWRATAYAWMPWVFLSLLVFLWGLPPVKAALEGRTPGAPEWIGSIVAPAWSIPGLDGQVCRVPPVVETVRAEAAVYHLNWLSATGTAIFVAAIISAVWLRISLAAFLSQLAQTLHRTRYALSTIACMLALAFTTRYSGTDATLGLAFTHTGALYPLFAPLLGWLGVALTGSDTSSNALFGSLQRITAEQLGLNPLLIVASNSTGGVMGKMIDAQSIVVAAVATEQNGQESRILRFVFPHSLVLACLVGLLTLAQSSWWSWMVPGHPYPEGAPISQPASPERVPSPAAPE